jgi:hypothetical protein
MIRVTHQCNSCVPDCKRGNLVSDKRLSVRRRVQLMRYESGQPEPGPTTGDIYAAWAMVLAFIFGFVLFSFV